MSAIVKAFLSLVVIVTIGPIDVGGAANIPVLPELTITALFAIWGIDWDGNGGS